MREYQGLIAFPTIPLRDNDSFREEAPCWDEAEVQEEVPRKASIEEQTRRIVCHLPGFEGAEAHSLEAHSPYLTLTL